MAEKSEGNGHKHNIHPISDEELRGLAERMESILVQAIYEATANRKADLVGKKKTVAELVANVNDPIFRENLKGFLLYLKVHTLLEVLKSPPFDVLSVEEVKEVQHYLAGLRAQSLHTQNDPPV